MGRFRWFFYQLICLYLIFNTSFAQLSASQYFSNASIQNIQDQITKPGLTQWLKLQGQAQDIAVTREYVYAIAPDGLIWRSSIEQWRKKSVSNWSKQPGRFKKLRASHDGGLWGISHTNQLYRYSGSIWRAVAKNVVDVATTLDSETWVLRKDGSLRTLKSNQHFAPKPVSLAQAQTLVADEHGLPWVLFSDGTILRFDGINWQTIATSHNQIKHISISLSGAAFAVRQNGELLKWRAGSSDWAPYLVNNFTLPFIKFVATDTAGLPWLIDHTGAILAEISIDPKPQEESIPSIFTRLLKWQQTGSGEASYISIAEDGTAFSLAGNGSIWQWQDKYMWKPSSGKLISIAAGNKGNAWGIDFLGRVQKFSNGMWQTVAGRKAKFVAVAPSNKLWALLDNNVLSEWDLTQRKWRERIPLNFEIKWLSISRQGVPWIITQSGLVRLYQNKKWIDIPGIQAETIDVGPENTVYASTSNELIYWLDQTEFKWKPATGKAQQIVVGPAGAPWIVADNKVLASARSIDNHEKTLEKIRLESVKKNPPSPVFTVTWPLPTLQAPLKFQTLPDNNRVQDIGIGSNGAVYAVGNEGSLLCFSNIDKRFLLASNGTNKRISVDSNGDPWLLSESGIVSYLEKGAWHSVPSFTGQDISISPNGNVWAAGTNGASYRFDRKTKLFELIPISQSTNSFKAKRIAGFGRNNYWAVGASNELMRCENNQCQLKMIGAQDVSLAPDGTVFVLDLLGKLHRFNVRAQKFEAQNGLGIALAVGPQGLPWLVAKNGKVNFSGIFFPENKNINPANCATNFTTLHTPQPKPASILQVVEDTVRITAGGSIPILVNDRLNGQAVSLKDVQIVLNDASGLLILRGDTVMVSTKANNGQTVNASYQLCPKVSFGACATAKLVIHISELPSAPTNVVASVNPQIPTDVTVTYSLPVSDGGAAITHFTASVFASNGGQALGISASSTSNRVSPISLDFSGYCQSNTQQFVEINVTSTNASGTSPASNLSSVQVCAPATAPSAPTNTVATVNSQIPTDVTVTYSLPVSDGGETITRFTATAFGSNGGPALGISASSTGSIASQISLNFSGYCQSNNQQFVAVSVTATNNKGTSPASNLSSVQVCPPATAPSAPTNTVASVNQQNSTDVTVTYNLPTSDGGSTITAYTATAFSTNGQLLGVSGNNAGGGLTQISLDFSNFCQSNTRLWVAISVTATNVIGTSLASKLSNVRVCPAPPPPPVTTVPNAPTNAAATVNPQIPTDVTVTYNLPTSDGGSAITGFTATAFDSNGIYMLGVSATNAGGGQTQISLDFSNYCQSNTQQWLAISVTATNVNGTSPASNLSDVQVCSSAP